MSIAKTFSGEKENTKNLKLEKGVAETYSHLTFVSVFIDVLIPAAPVKCFLTAALLSSPSRCQQQQPRVPRGLRHGAEGRRSSGRRLHAHRPRPRRAHRHPGLLEVSPTPVPRPFPLNPRHVVDGVGGARDPAEPVPWTPPIDHTCIGCFMCWMFDAVSHKYP